MNLYDILLARCICSNKSEESVIATPLEVTENGTYEAAEGYAYNPVIVNNKLSLANVTITNNTSDDITGFLVFVNDDDDSNSIGAELEIAPNESVTFRAVLYKGRAQLQISSAAIETMGDENVSVTGGVVVTDFYFGVTLSITGDGTVTITE